MLHLAIANLFLVIFVIATLLLTVMSISQKNWMLFLLIVTLFLTFAFYFCYFVLLDCCLTRHTLVMSLMCACLCFRGHVMPMPSLTSHLIMRPISVSCAVMSLTCWTVRMPSAGGGGAVEEWACSHQTMCSQFTTELQLCVSMS